MLTAKGLSFFTTYSTTMGSRGRNLSFFTVAFTETALAIPRSVSGPGSLGNLEWSPARVETLRKSITMIARQQEPFSKPCRRKHRIIARLATEGAVGVVEVKGPVAEEDAMSHLGLGRSRIGRMGADPRAEQIQPSDPQPKSNPLRRPSTDAGPIPASVVAITSSPRKTSGKTAS